jgi:hypothetical protein
MTSKKVHKIIFGGAALAAVTLTVGGGYLLTAANAVDTRQSHAPSAPSLVNHDPEVRQELLGLFAGSATRYAAEQELIRRCMEQRGFKYVKNPAPTRDVAPTLGPDPYGLAVENAKTTGYNSAENAGDSPAEVDRFGVSDLSDKEKQEWGEAYFGPENAPEVTVDLPGGGAMGTTSEGCLAEARKTLYGSLSDNARLTFLSGNFPLWAKREASSDPDMARIDSAWSACMVGKGHSGLKNPEAAREKAIEAHRRLGIASEEARNQEVALAIADAECEKTTNYAAQRVTIEDHYYKKYLNKFASEVAEMKKMNDSALARAKQVLGIK